MIIKRIDCDTSKAHIARVILEALPFGLSENFVKHEI